METADIGELTRKISGQTPQAGGVLFGFTMWGIIASLVFSGIGFIYFRYGKYKGNGTMMMCGVAMMLYPYFVSDTLYIVLVGAGLIILTEVLNRI